VRCGKFGLATHYTLLENAIEVCPTTVRYDGFEYRNVSRTQRAGTGDEKIAGCRDLRVADRQR
jgi:hypothetical protein